MYNLQGWRVGQFFLEKYFTRLGYKVTVLDSAQVSYWTNFYGVLPFYLAKGKTVSVQDVEKEHGKKFDGFVEVDGTGQYHLTGLKKFSGFKVLWSIDTHLQNKRNFHRFYQDDYDFLFTCHREYISDFKKNRMRWLPVGCDVEIQKKINCPEIYDVVFVGNLNSKVYPERVRLLDLLSKKFKVGAFQGVYGDKACGIFSQGKIIFNYPLAKDLNFRVFEAMAYEKLLITQKTENGLTEFFKDGKHLAFYESEQELISKIERYLKDEDLRRKVAKAGYSEVTQKHSMNQRVKDMMDIVLETV